VPLPLFSYGGTSMVTTMIGTGLLLNISMRRFMF
jgi:rod shape determining protein RodA